MRFEAKGLAGLSEGQRSGRPRRLSETQLQEVDRALRQTPRDLGLRGTLWDGKTLSAWIEQHFQVHLAVRQCQRLFRQRGFRPRKPRPQIAHADAERQQTHKKTSGAKPSTPALISGPWTKCTFSNTARAAACGSRPKPRIRCCFIIPPARVWATWGHPGARRQILLPAGDGQIQRGNLLAVPESPARHQHAHGSTGGGDRRQRPIPPCPTAPRLEAGKGRAFRS